MFDVAIIMGSDSDLEVMQDAAKFLDLMGISYEMKILSVHRTPEKAMEYAKGLNKNGVKVIIAGAGGAAHLPRCICSYGSNCSCYWYSYSYKNFIWFGFFVFYCANAITVFLLQQLLLMVPKMLQFLLLLCLLLEIMM